MAPSDLELGLEELENQVTELKSLSEREVNKKEEWRARIREVSQVHEWIRDQLQQWKRHHDRSTLDDVEHQELLKRVRHSIPDSVIGAFDEEHKSLTRASSVVNQLLDACSSSITSLSADREVLKGAQRRVLDMMTALGVTNSTLKIIERRSMVDNILVLGGMMLTSVCLYIIWMRIR